MGPLSRVVNLKILYQFGDEDLVIWTATSASMNRSTASEILEWMINPLCATAFIDILFENIKIHYEKKQMFKQLLWNTVIYLVSAVSADGLGHPHALRWPEGIGTLGANTHLKKRCNYTDNMIAKQIEGTNSDVKILVLFCYV